jgi:hypothetical protein
MLINKAIHAAIGAGRGIALTYEPGLVIYPTNNTNCCIVIMHLAEDKGLFKVVSRWNPTMEELTSEKWIVTEYPVSTLAYYFGKSAYARGGVPEEVKLAFHKLLDPLLND